MSNLTIIPNSESAITINQLALFLDSSEVQKAKETSKDLLSEIAEAVRRIKKLGLKNEDLYLCKQFEYIPIATFKFICNQYKIIPRYRYDRFTASISCGKYYHRVELDSEKTEIALLEIQTINQDSK
jgi:hypothetical protein